MASRKTRRASGSQGLPSRRAAAQLITLVLRDGLSLDKAGDRSREFLDLNSRDKAFVWLLALSCLRHLGEIDSIISHCLNRPLPKQATEVHDLLRIGATQVLFVDTPPYAAVNSMVSLAATTFPVYKNLVNAILRRIAREGKDYLQGLDATYLNTPCWMWDSWVSEYGENETRRIAEANVRKPPLDITAKDPEATELLVKGRRMPAGSIRVHSEDPVAAMPGFSEGLWWVQDLAATFPVKMLGNVSGRQVVDLCAAPGGKTAQLCNAGAEVTSLDISPNRLEILKENLGRLSFSSKIVCSDVREWRPEHLQEFVLLDAPCTGTGTIRRHPDILRRRTPDQVVNSVKLLDQLLLSASEMISIGGILVFSTCSLQGEEGFERIQAFLLASPGFIREPISADLWPDLEAYKTEQGDLRTLPCHLEKDGGMDGFFAARLKRIF